MNWFALWFDPQTGRVRSGWRVALYLFVLGVVTVFALYLLLLPAQLFGLDPTKFLTPHATPAVPDIPFVLITDLAMIMGCVAAAVMLLRYLEHLPSATLGLGLGGGRHLLALAGGFVAATGLVGVLLALGAALHLLTIHPQPWSPHLLPHLLLAIGGLLILAATSELLTHGYIFQTLLRGIGMPITLLLVAAVSALLFANTNAPLAITNLALEAILFGLLYLRAAHLWLPIGVAAGWNFGLLCCHLRISGTEIPLDTPFIATLAGHPLLTGGDFGPEGGVLASAVLLAAIAVVTYAPIGLPLTSRWWAWLDLTTPASPLPAWDFTIDGRPYQWKLLPHEPSEQG